MTMKEIRDLSPAEQEELRASVANIMGDPAYARAFEKLREQYIQTLLAEQVGTLTSHTLHASLRVLEDVKAELASMVTLIRHNGKLTRG